MKVKLWLVMTAILVLTVPVWAEELDVKEGVPVSGIEVTGNSAISAEAIMSPVLTRVGDPLSADKVRGDMKAIYAEGNFSDVKVGFESYAGGTKIIFKVQENPVITRVDIQGVTVYSSTEVRSLVTVAVGQVLNYQTLRDDIKRLEDKYKADGYVLAKVVDVSSDAATGIVTFEVVEGVIEDISLEGNKVTKDYVIMRELKSEEGKPLNQNNLKRDIGKVTNLNFFKSVEPKFEPGKDPDKVALILAIEEKKTASVNFGGGYGDRQGWFGFVDLTWDNLLGTGQNTMVRGQFGQELQTYQLRYFIPWVFPHLFGGHTGFTARRWYTVGRDIFNPAAIQDQIKNGWDLGFSKVFSDAFSASITVGSEKISPTSTATFEPYTSDTISLSLSYDTRDIWINPHSGAFYTFSIRNGWKHAGSGESAFTKYTPDLNWYLPTSENGRFAVHLGLGMGLGDVPLSEVYYMGGANTVRGYEINEVRFGRRQTLLNLEYRYDFNDMLQVVGFFDSGNAWDSGFIDPSQFMTGRGLGVRLNTPVGPIRLDYGIAAYRDSGVFHFSIGQAF